jgi:iron-sulfur cluster repair protein YtfE (RIC family)
MASIVAFMTDDHRACDAHLAEAETRVQKEQWVEAAAAWAGFERSLRCHLRREEEHLFPAFEDATGNRQGPTAVMRMEHDQMRALLAGLDGAVSARDAKRFLGLSDSLMVLIQQHNMKEEQMLYPMCDQAIPDAGAVRDRMAALQPEQG